MSDVSLAPPAMPVFNYNHEKGKNIFLIHEKQIIP